MLKAHGGGQQGRSGGSPGELQGRGDPAEEQKELTAARPEAKRVCRSPRGAACSRARPRASGKGEQRARAGADTATQQTSVQGRAGASRAARGSPLSSPAPGASERAPRAACGVQAAPQEEPRCGAEAQQPPCKPGRASGHQKHGCCLLLLLTARNSKGAPCDAAAARSHRREQNLAPYPSSSSVPAGISDLASRCQPGSAQCFHQCAPCKLLSPPGHAGGSGLPEPPWVLQTAGVISSGQKHLLACTVRDRGQPGFSCATPSRGPHPCQGTRVTEGKEIPAKTLILFFKNKKNPKTDKTS